MEEAIYDARHFFEDESKPIDRYLFPNLVRYHAKESLTTGGHAVVEEEGGQDGVEFIRDANNGLILHYSDYVIRTLKTDDGKLPVLHSETREMFYFQPPLNREMLGIADDGPIFRKLVILWQVDSGCSFTEMRLAAPRIGGRRRGNVSHYFNQALPRGTELITPSIADDSVIDEPQVHNTPGEQEATGSE
jgi:hypothetical protein